MSPSLSRATVVFAGGLLFVSAFPAPRATAQDDTHISYRLLNTRLVVTGTVTSKKSFATEEREYTPGDAVLNLVIEPDATTLQLDPAAAVLSKENLTVQVGPNGGLRSLNGASEGQLGLIIRNVFSVIVGAVKVVGTVRTAATSDAENKYQQVQPAEQNRRKALRAAIDDAVDRVAETGRAAAVETDPAKLKSLSARIDALLAVIKTVRGELEPLDVRFTSWKSQFQDAKTETLAYHLRIAQVPDDAVMEPVLGTAQTSQTVASKLDGTPKEIFQRLGVVITKVDRGAQGVGQPAAAADRKTTLFYRIPRPVVFRLYSLGDVGKESRLALRKVSIENVVDELSPMESVTLSASKWARKSLMASFSENGVLTQLANERGSELAGATEAAKGLPADYLAALKLANDVAEQQRKLALQALDARVDRLNKEKAEKEASLALREVDDVGDLKAQIARLDLQARLLESERTLQTSTDSGEARRQLQADQQVMALENAIAAARAERLELEAKLERLRREAGR